MDASIQRLYDDYTAKMLRFFEPCFTSKEELNEYWKHIQEFDWNDRRPRRMIGAIFSFVTMAKGIDKVWPPRDGLRAIFLKMCLESLKHLSDRAFPDFYTQFAKGFGHDGEIYLSERLKVSFSTKKIEDVPIKVTPNVLLGLIKSLRDNAVHDGEYWDAVLFSLDAQTITTSYYCSDWDVEGNKRGEFRTYHIETTMILDEFLLLFTAAALTYVTSYMKRLTKKSMGTIGKSMTTP